MGKDESKKAVKAAFEYLLETSPNRDELGNFRLEEIEKDNDGYYLIVLGYEEEGEFGFDKKKKLKRFKVGPEGKVEWMKIYKE